MVTYQEAEERIRADLGSYCSYLHISVAKLFISPNSDSESMIFSQRLYQS